MAKPMSYWIIRALGCLVGVPIMLVYLLMAASGEGYQHYLNSMFGLSFMVYGVFGQKGLARMAILLKWPLVFPLAIASLGWSLFQLWSAFYVQEICYWPQSDPRVWSVEPTNFLLGVLIQVFILIQASGVLCLLWSSLGKREQYGA